MDTVSLLLVRENMTDIIIPGSALLHTNIYTCIYVTTQFIT